MKQWSDEIMESGYFLINVIVAIAIIGLMTTLSIPYIRNFQRTLKLSSAQKEITSNLRLAQQSAVTQQVVYSVKFYVDHNDYEILKLNNGETSTVKYVELPDNINIQEVSDSDDNEVEFNFYGGVDEPCQVVLSNSQDKLGKINIKPSGYVELKQ